MQQSKVSKSLSSRRPRSAGRPRSEGTTRTKSYFDEREGTTTVGTTTVKEEDVSVTGPSIHHSKKETFPPMLCGDNDDDDRILQVPLLGNFDFDSDLFEWETTRTIKPRNAFVDDLQVHFIRTARRNCEMTTSLETIRKSEFLSLETYWLAARVFIVVWNSIFACLLTCCSIMTRLMKKRNDYSIRQINEDGLVSDSLIFAPILRASNRVRVEDRIRRELDLEGKRQRRQSENGNQDFVSPYHDNDSAAASDLGSDVVIMDESYWTIPGKDFVSPKRRSGNVPSEVEVTIDIGQIKFSHNQVFTAQEKALARVSCLYDQYRLQMEANTFRTSVSKVTETCQQLRSIHDAAANSGKVSGDSSSVLKYLFNDLQSSTISLVTELESIKNISQQMKQCWNEFLRTRDDTDSYYDDVVLKSSLPYSELNNDLKKLAEEMKCTKPVLSRMIDDESSVDSFKILQDLESIVLSDTNHIAEVIELVQPPKRDLGKLRFEKVDKYFARLLVNSHVVGDTKTERLDRRSFSVRLSHRFNCRLLQKPTDTCVQVWKTSSGFLPDVLICNCFFNIQDASEVSNSSDDETRFSDANWLQFASKNSNVKGMIWIAARAVERAVKRPSFAVRVSNIPIHYLPHRTRLIRLGGFDPYLHMSTPSKPRIRSCPDMQSAMEFKHSNGILFSNKMIFEEPLRHVLIKKRRENNSSGPSHIPITELEVQGSDAFHDMIKNDVDLNEESVAHDAINERPYVNKLHTIELFRRVREFSQRTCARKYHFSEVIQDVSIYRTFPQLLSLTFPPAKRSLYPKSSHFLPVKSRMQSRSLLLTVIGGLNVPRKVEGTAAESTGEEVLKKDTEGRQLPKMEAKNETCVGVLVKIRCRGKRYQTNFVNCGTSSPHWRETFCIPLCDKLGDIFASDLSDEMIHLSLYDSATVDLKNIGGIYEDEDSSHFEMRYLGRASFPLGIALSEGKVNGFINCQSPFSVVGYIKGNGETNENSAIDCSSQLYCSPMIHVHMTTEPFTVIPPHNRMEFPSIETELILSRLTKWAQNHLDVSSVLWPDSVGYSNIASRFLTEQAPPPGFNTLTSCANFVSLIPSIHLVDWKALKERDNEMTLTSQQFINILVGTRREHTILLTNFFLYLSKSDPVLAAEVLLAVGFSVPEGVTTFVLRRCRKTREVLVWDAMTGRAYPQTDNSCPLQKIHCLVSAGNMYRNAEPDKTLSLLDFDISNVRKWVPLHNINEESKFARLTVQDERLQFALPNHHRAKETQINVCESIQSSIRGWRHTATCFRPDISAKVALKLEQLENAKLNGLPTSNVEMSLNERMMQSRMTGFILHEPFNSVQDILDTIKASEIHRNRNPHVEYVVSVRAFAYPGGVSSVWVCVCLVKES